MSFLGFQKAELGCQKAELACHNAKKVNLLIILTPLGATFFMEINNFSNAIVLYDFNNLTHG